ncbi:porin family protein [Photobacterium sp. ZSDE20]|uniref:Porin family protein n=1 Tax=Photobacterium pectinilyticum TaxID=2906793 RepID=A0ABT1N1P6_9GAMM|nr:porin family protein [Photobacterium sp. ZSDE20]MCQ1058047.1 porin family protein [Photobacterium sp. ZSDE20]MDD1822580.1 porin family protein [Photobacterium sp. ZSDE20]
MKKYAVASALILATLAATPALANTTEWFVGGGIGYQNDKVEQDFILAHPSKNAEDVTYQFRGGAIVNDQHRFTATYSYFEDKYNGALGFENKLTQNMYLASYDYLIPVQEKVNLFAGVTMGYADNKIKTDFGSNSSTDFVWGGQVGAQYKLSNNLSTDLTYRYLDQDYKEGLNQIDYTQQVVWSVDYRF